MREKSYGIIHDRIRKIRPKPADGKCEICGKVKDKYGYTKLVLSNIKNHNYTLNPDDYQWAHNYSCHREYDIEKRESKSKNDKSQIAYWIKLIN